MSSSNDDDGGSRRRLHSNCQNHRLRRRKYNGNTRPIIVRSSVQAIQRLTSNNGPLPLFQTLHFSCSRTDANGEKSDHDNAMSSNSDVNTKMLFDFLIHEAGVTDDEDDDGNNYSIHEAIIKAIQDIHGLKKCDVTVSHLESLGRDTLQALAASIQVQSKRKSKQTKSTKRPITIKKQPIQSLSVRLHLRSSAATNHDGSGNHEERPVIYRLACR